MTNTESVLLSAADKKTSSESETRVIFSISVFLFFPAERPPLPAQNNKHQERDATSLFPDDAVAIGTAKAVERKHTLPVPPQPRQSHESQRWDVAL